MKKNRKRTRICFPKIQNPRIHKGGNPQRSLNAWVIRLYGPDPKTPLMSDTVQSGWGAETPSTNPERVSPHLLHGVCRDNRIWGNLTPSWFALDSPILAFCTSLAGIKTFSAKCRGYTTIPVWQLSFCIVPLHHLNGAGPLYHRWISPRKVFHVLLHTSASGRSKRFPLYRETEI